MKDEQRAEREIEPENVLRVRVGHGANCSSIGSVVDTLFATAAVGAAVFAAVVAALKNEDVRIAGSPAGGARRDGEPDQRGAKPDAERA
jgi:hypothetical protein